MLIRFSARQTDMLTRRAQVRGTSFSEEVRDAVDFYLEMPVKTREERNESAVEANRAADRMISHLDKTIARVDKVLSEMNSRRKHRRLTRESKK